MEEGFGFWRRLIPSRHILLRIGGILIPTMIYALGVTLFVHYLDYPPWKAGTEWVAINGLVLGTLLVFRNKEAYERWWEARKLWGQLINDLRNLALKIRANINLTDPERREVARLLIAFPHALKCHLRDDEDLHHVPGFEKESDRTDHLPLYISGLLLNLLAKWNREDRMKDLNWVLDPHARALMDVCGACERIHSSPVPFSYRALLKNGIGLYLILSPWSLALETGYWALPILALAFYFLLGIEMVAEDVEEPFGLDTDDLPLERLCVTIQKSVEEIFPETQHA